MESFGYDDDSDHAFAGLGSARRYRQNEQGKDQHDDADHDDGDDNTTDPGNDSSDDDDAEDFKRRKKNNASQLYGVFWKLLHPLLISSGIYTVPVCHSFLLNFRSPPPSAPERGDGLFGFEIL